MSRVVDGDTIHVVIDGRDSSLRYIGMDSPESVKPGTPVQAFARDATKANEALVGGQQVILEKDVSETDRFGRLLRDVWLQRDTGYVLVDYELVLHGFARVRTFPPDVKYEPALLVAQEWAQSQHLGLWSVAAPTPSATSKPSSRKPSPGAPRLTATPTAAPPVGFVGRPGNCDPSYPDRCIPPPPPDLDCADIGHRVRVLPPDPHHLDGDHNGFGCERYPP